MADLKKAGINPILAASKEASSPAGAMAQMQNGSAGAINSALNAATIGSTIQTTALTKNKTGILKLGRKQRPSQQASRMNPTRQKQLILDTTVTTDTF